MAEFLATSDIARIAILMAIFALVVIAAYLGLNAVSRRIALRGELAALAGGGVEASELSPGSVKMQERASAWANLADLVERTGLNLTDTKSDRLRDACAYFLDGPRRALDRNLRARAKRPTSKYAVARALRAALDGA